MPNLYDVAYGLGLAATAPFWLLAGKARRKVLRALRERTGRAAAVNSGDPTPAAGSVVLIHAVSLGEINATRDMVRSLAAARPGLRCVVSVTTDTGYARGQELYGSDPKVTLIRYPLDFSGALSRVLDRYRPDVVVLMELEVWPNFILHCERRGIPVLLVNGRLTTTSFRNYRRLRPLVVATFRRLSVVCAQDQVYADRFVALGTPPDRVKVTGTMKFDTAEVAATIQGAEELARAVGLAPAAGPVWVCGSTGPGEEQILLRVYRRLLADHPPLRLVLVPRHPQRFDEVAGLIRGEGFDLIRRSETRGKPVGASAPSEASNLRPHTSDPNPPVILGDTMGELRKFYNLATVVFVGRSLLDLGTRQRGSDMIEPAALGKPVVVGPWTHNFAEAMIRFREAEAVKVVAGEEPLRAAVAALLADPAAAGATGERARAVVRREQGATARHVEVILAHLKHAGW